MKRGFTLIELTVVLAIIGLVIGGGMATLTAGVQQSGYNSTVATMNAIDQAILNYKQAFGRIPCPGDLTLAPTSSYYGLEAGAGSGSSPGVGTGECIGASMHPSANNGTASTTAEEGSVPTRSLRLADTYMYDGWGRKIRYAVSPSYTANLGSATACSAAGSGKVLMVSDSHSSQRSQAAAYVLVSHGATGHGGYTMYSGSTMFNAGNQNATQLKDCHCTSGAATNPPYDSTYYQEAPYYTSGYSGNSAYYSDSIVSFREPWQLMAPSQASASVANSFGCTTSAYADSRSITINSAYVSTVSHTSLTSFPFLFSGTYSYLATTANSGNVTNSNGYDIIFTSDAAGNNILPFERESYNPANGAVVFWINIPTVSGSANTTIYMWDGNSNITTDKSNKAGTWNSNYRGVWHLGEGSGAPQDSTSYGSNGSITATGGGTVTQGVAGVFGNGISVNSGSSGNSYVSVANPADGHLDFGSTGSLSVSIWVATNTLPSSSGFYNYLYKGCAAQSCGAGYGLYGESSSGKDNFDTSASNNTSQQGEGSNPSYANGSWNQVVMTIDRSAQKMYEYVNGQVIGTSVSMSGIGSLTSSIGLYVGCQTNSPPSCANSINAKMQEAHVYSGVETPDWIVTEYNNQSAPGTFYSVGASGSR